MTLLLGPPGSGKTTLLLSLAGKAVPPLKVSCTILQATCIIESQHDHDGCQLQAASIVQSARPEKQKSWDITFLTEFYNEHNFLIIYYITVAG